MLTEFKVLHKIIDYKSYDKVFELYEKEFHLYKDDFSKYTKISSVGEELFNQKIVCFKGNQEQISIFLENEQKSILIEFRNIEIHETIEKSEKDTLKRMTIYNHKNENTQLYDFKKITLSQSLDQISLHMVLHDSESKENKFNIGKLTIVSETQKLRENICDIFSGLTIVHGEHSKSINLFDKKTDYNKFQDLIIRFLSDKKIDDVMNFVPRLSENKNPDKIRKSEAIEEKELLKNLILKVENSLIGAYIKKTFDKSITDNIFIAENYSLYGTRMINKNNPNIFFQSGSIQLYKEKHSCLHIMDDFKIYSINEKNININNKSIKFDELTKINFSEIIIQENKLFYKIEDLLGRRNSLSTSYPIFDYERGNSQQAYERLLNKAIIELGVMPRNLTDIAFPVGSVLDRIDLIQLERDINYITDLTVPFKKAEEIILFEKTKEDTKIKLKM